MNSDALQRYVDSRDPEAFRELVQDYQDLVYGTCRRVLGKHPQLDDAVQETFIKLAKRAGAVRSNLGAWLHACARSTALDTLKADRPRRKQERLMREEPATATLTTRSDDERSENNSIVDACLDELDEQDREVVVSYFFVRHSQEEIAHRIGVTQGTVQRRIERVLEILRRKLIGRGVAVSGAMAAFLVDLDAESRIPSTLAQSIAAINPSIVAKTAAASAKVAVKTGIGSGLGKLIACGIAALGAIGAGWWLQAKPSSSAPAKFSAAWNFAQPDSAGNVILKGDWEWIAADKAGPAGLRIRDDKNGGSVTLPRELPAKPFVVSIRFHGISASQPYLIVFGWNPSGQRVAADFIRRPEMPVMAEASYDYRFYYQPEAGDYLVETFESEVLGVLRYTSAVTKKHCYIQGNNLVLESIDITELDPSQIPEAIRRPEILASDPKFSHVEHLITH